MTNLEEKVLEIISWGDDYEETPTECFDNIMSSFNGSKDQLKGVLGSLLKKQLISEGEYPNGLTSYHLNNQNKMEKTYYKVLINTNDKQMDKMSLNQLHNIINDLEKAITYADYRISYKLNRGQK